MDKLIKFVLTVVLTTVLVGINFVVTFIVALMAGIGFSIIGLSPDSGTGLILTIAVTYCVIRIPIAAILAFVFYKGIISKGYKKYGLLGGPIAIGMLCWVFNLLAVSYYVVSLKWPVETEEDIYPVEGAKKKFVIGLVLGLILSIVLTSVNILVKQ